jgi:3-phenylpropionate/trans-cinnamate dioxygenase ferredoxin reductase subunit
MPDTYVIAGGGLAGAKAAEALRAEGFEGRLLLVGAETELPYERPPLSKDYLRGEAPREQARVHPASFYEDYGVELRIGTALEAIDPAAHTVRLSDGDVVGYDRLLLATGAEPRRLRAPGAELDGIHYLRDFGDADRIAARLKEGGRLAVVGGGWIGAEVAASARQRGVEVTLVERGPAPLAVVLGTQVARIYAQLHRDHGVELLTGAAVEGFEGDGRVERVRLADGRRLDADWVVAGLGVLPRTGVAAAAGLEVDDGIVVDERLETSVPGIFAAGDVASAQHPFYGHRLRVEHWANALHQPETAARTMLGKPAAYERLPYFFSDQYDVGMEYAGYATQWDEIVIRGDAAAREFIAFWLKDGCVVAGMNVNVWEVTDAIQAIIRSRRPVDLQRLRDPGVPLEDLVAPAGVGGTPPG